METFLSHIFKSIGIKLKKKYKKANCENQEETVSSGFPLFSNVPVRPNLSDVRSNLTLPYRMLLICFSTVPCVTRQTETCGKHSWRLLNETVLTIRAETWDFQQCGILASGDSDEPVQLPVKLRNPICCSVSSLMLKEYSNDKQRLWSDCAYAQASLSLCWSHIPHCWKSHVAAHTMTHLLELSWNKISRFFAPFSDAKIHISETDRVIYSSSFHKGWGGIQPNW